MIETPIDTRAMIDPTEFAVSVDLRNGTVFDGIFDQIHDYTLDINGRRSQVRLPADDAAQVAIGQVIDVGCPPVSYTVRAIERGQRTSVLVLEQA